MQILQACKVRQEDERRKRTSSNIVYGYDKTIGDYFNLAINKEESKVVQQIYKWYTEEGYGAAKIANMLNEKGYKTKQKLQMESECNVPYFNK